MNKTEVVAAIAKDSKLSQDSADKFLKSLIAVVTEAVKKGEKVLVPGFISFTKAKRNARTGRNPQTGKEIKIAAKNVIKIKAGSKLSEAANQA